MGLPRPSRKLTQDETTGDKPVKIRAVKATDYRPSDVFEFDPKVDITVHQLARLIWLLYEPRIHFTSYLDLPEDLQRHFRPTKV